MSNINLNLGENYGADLKIRLDKYGITLSDLARELEKDLAQVSKWVNGHQQPRIDTVYEIESAIVRLRKSRSAQKRVKRTADS